MMPAHTSRDDVSRRMTCHGVGVERFPFLSALDAALLGGGVWNTSLCKVATRSFSGVANISLGKASVSSEGGGTGTNTSLSTLLRQRCAVWSCSLCACASSCSVPIWIRCVSSSIFRATCSFSFSRLSSSWACSMSLKAPWRRACSCDTFSISAFRSSCSASRSAISLFLPSTSNSSSLMRLRALARRSSFSLARRSLLASEALRFSLRAPFSLARLSTSCFAFFSACFSPSKSDFALEVRSSLRSTSLLRSSFSDPSFFTTCLAFFRSVFSTSFSSASFCLPSSASARSAFSATASLASSFAAFLEALRVFFKLSICSVVWVAVVSLLVSSARTPSMSPWRRILSSAAWARAAWMASLSLEMSRSILLDCLLLTLVSSDAAASSAMSWAARSSASALSAISAFTCAISDWFASSVAASTPDKDDTLSVSFLVFSVAVATPVRK
mmetsp:Transcript_13507/g.22825  ORF Transcript_13507/g.22825 Transcript_13507/m.22825 type:complete len:444 (-) Transcript_13507:2456-3787(-)